MPDDAIKELTLEEWVGQLPDIHRAHGELASLKSRITELEAVVEAGKKALGFSQSCREFSDEWHDMNNPDVVYFRELRAEFFDALHALNGSNQPKGDQK